MLPLSSMAPTRSASSLERLRRVGVRIAMDHFGSGYSSLGYLRALPLDILKIDQSFVEGIATDSHDRAIVSAIVGLGRQTDCSVIAEGVETEALHTELVGIGCELAQGFLYEHPRPPEQLSLESYCTRLHPGTGDPLGIGEFTHQI